jgi:methylenetetrahydrofolate reductase (NADPH)
MTVEVAQQTESAASGLERLLSEGNFAVTAELGPPKSADAEAVRKKAKLLAPVVDAVNITDNQTAIVRMSSIAAAKVALDHGCEPVMQMTCRDRNVLAIQSDILGAYALGIRNILCLTGDHQKFGNHPSSKNVFDVDSVQLVQIVARMRSDGVFANGEPIQNSKRADVVAPKMFVGAAASPLADPVGIRVPRLAKKVAAGARFVQTQLIYDMDRFKTYMRDVVQRGLHERVSVLAGVMPVKSARALKYMNDNLAGIRVPQAFVERMHRAEKAARESVSGSDGEAEAARKRAVGAAARAEGIQIAVELIEQLRDIEGVRGVHIMAVEWEEAIPEIVQRAGLR